MFNLYISENYFNFFKKTQFYLLLQANKDIIKKNPASTPVSYVITNLNKLIFVLT